MNSLAQKQGIGAIIWDYLTTVDHKKIAKLYLFSGLLYFVVGGIEALLIRLQLMFPMNDLLVGRTFNEVITAHGVTMLFFVAMPLVFALGNLVLPLQIGARDVAFPFLNSLGFWLFFFGALFYNVGWFMGDMPAAGWTSYASLSMDDPTRGVDFYVIGLQIGGIGSLIGAINFIATVVTMRAPGMTFMRMPLFTWTIFMSSVMILFAFPPLTVGLFLLFFDRLFNGAFFNEVLGGNTIIYEHLFWIFGHPEVYILVLPAFGAFSEIVAVFSRKRLFGYTAMVFAVSIIGFLGMMVWAHHLFTVGLGPVANSIFSVATMAIAVPTGIKIFNWLFTMWGGNIKFTTPMLYTVWFIPTFVMGGVTGVMLASGPADYQFHDTYFVVAHFHYVIAGGVVLGLFAGLHYWWPKMFGVMLSDKVGKISFWLWYIGFHLTFFIQHFVGMWGMPRRVYTYLPDQGWDAANFISSIGALVMTLSVIVMVSNFVWSWFAGEKAEGDAWGDGRTLEWAIPSPPPEYNFIQTPLVRGIDALWIEKMEGDGKMKPAEKIGDIHMPNGSILPLIMSLGLFISGFGFMFHDLGTNKLALAAAIGGLVITLGCMFVRSIKDDFGYHIHKEDLERDAKGANA
ncbi:cytochrome c oxidase subunit I [Bacillus solimangrovi]|uniref:Cytochrome c oxidase subunit 1 n=1 Tax=Bacillus solimangrovi TaxID=1305675 RepID=A0A1E5LIL5_9BACI|nr:cbb3-type cytochrome c oxidase subunit I [Bacillus solimangrovi]OEH93915.1 cytochrome ubiquinol oxidase subunit I [Bacillus solimangrovi]